MFRSTSLFGGVQVFNILITIVRGKLVSVLLGTTGMGMNGLFMSTVNMIKNFTSLGIPESAVKDIAAAEGAGDRTRITRVISVFEHWIWFTALLGVLVTLALAHYLSLWTFGNTEHRLSFMILSVVFVFTALAGGTYTLLRGLRRLRHLALANVLGGVLGLIVSLPFFYFYGTDGVVPAIVANAAAAYLLSLYFKKKLDISRVAVPAKAVVREGVGMAQLGIVLSFTSFLTAGVAFVVNAYITRTGSFADVGLYNAGVTITTGYVGIVFTAMITDYFPRLTACIHDEVVWKQTVVQQAELVLLILTPILVLFITTAPLILRVLLTSEFLPVISYFNWAVPGIFLQGIIWALGVIIVAKGDMKLKFYSEITGQAVQLVATIAGYAYWGLQGLGIGLFASNVFGFVMMAMIARSRYKFSLSWDFVKLSFFLATCCVAACVGSFYLGFPNAYFTGAFVFCLVTVFSYYHLNKRLQYGNIIKLITDKFARK